MHSHFLPPSCYNPFMNFSPEIKKSEPINTLKGEHLNEGTKPIIGCIYNRNELTHEDDIFFNNFKKNATFVDFSINREDAKKEGFYTSGKKTYIISKIDKENKFSEKYYDCTGVFATGLDINNGENISFLSHQNPEEFLKNPKILSNLKEDLNKSLNELIKRSKPGSIDVAVLGGNKNILAFNAIDSVDFDKMNTKQMYDFFEKQNPGSFDDYKKSIYFLSKIIFDKLNFYPTITSGPNSNVKLGDITHDNHSDLYCDTKNRRIYQIRPENESINNESFMGDEINNKIKDFN